jgi:hypothetical protein
MTSRTIFLHQGGAVTQHFLEVGVTSFKEALDWVHKLPYGRNQDRADYSKIFEEWKGTCSTKDAALAALARVSPQGAKMAQSFVSSVLETHVCPYTLKFLGFSKPCSASIFSPL